MVFILICFLSMRDVFTLHTLFSLIAHSSDSPGETTNSGSVTALHGGNVTLKCECADQGNPSGEYKWRTPDGNREGQVLFLDNLNINTDEGQYECYVKNTVEEGPSSSLVLTLHCETFVF